MSGPWSAENRPKTAPSWTEKALAFCRGAVFATYGSPRLYLDPFFSETLGELLRRAGTRLAVFSACNSGRWCFVEPLLRAGVSVVVGIQGTVLTISAAEFCQKLYSALVLGLSIEEAATWARLHLLETDGSGMEDAWD